MAKACKRSIISGLTLLSSSRDLAAGCDGRSFDEGGIESFKVQVSEAFCKEDGEVMLKDFKSAS